MWTRRLRPLVPMSPPEMAREHPIVKWATAPRVEITPPLLKIYASTIKCDEYPVPFLRIPRLAEANVERTRRKAGSSRMHCS